MSRVRIASPASKKEPNTVRYLALLLSLPGYFPTSRGWRESSHKPGSVPHRRASRSQSRDRGSYLSGTHVTARLERYTKLGPVKDQPSFRDLAPNRGLPSQHLSILLVRSYRTFAPLPFWIPTKRNPAWRYVSVALSSRSLALGITQQVWSFGCPDFPQSAAPRRGVRRASPREPTPPSQHSATASPTFPPATTLAGLAAR